MQLYNLTSDETVHLFEDIETPYDEHIRLEQAGTLYKDSFLSNKHTRPIFKTRKELVESELQEESLFLQNFMEDFDHYHFTVFLRETERLYNAYCWNNYKEGRHVRIEYSYFQELIVEWFTARYIDDENSTEELDNKVNQQDKEIEKKNHLHVFEKEQMELKKRLYKESLYARHTEDYYHKHQKLPEPEFIEKSLEEKVVKNLNTFDHFCEKARKETSLNHKTHAEDFHFSFLDNNFIFFYGKTVYIFEIIENDFYLKGKKVDLKIFFSNLRKEKKKVWRHSIRINKMFKKNGIEYNEYGPDFFFVYRIVNNQDDFFYIRYKNAECRLNWDYKNFYRPTGELIIKPEIIVHEMIENDYGRKKAKLKAKQFFQTFLNKSEKNQFHKHKSVFVKGKKYDYVFCPEFYYNPIIRINKETKLKESLCVMFDNPYIPRYDVVASAMLLVKSGQEELLNEKSNAFELTDKHENKLKKLKIS